MNISRKKLIPLLAGLAALQPLKTATAAVTYLPNNHGKSLTTPVAWGAYCNVAFIGVGGTYATPYNGKSDGAAVIGAGFGDPVKNVGAQFLVTSVDLTEWKEYSGSVHLFKKLGEDNAFGIGVESIMLSSGGDAEKSFYAVYSQGVQHDMFVNSATGRTKLHFSVGAGTGRFADKTDFDVADGKGKHGTYVFGNVAYEIADQFNLITDWNGTNLNAGVSKTFMFGKYPVAVTVGVADLTDNSGDRARMIGAIGTGFKFK